MIRSMEEWITYSEEDVMNAVISSVNTNLSNTITGIITYLDSKRGYLNCPEELCTMFNINIDDILKDKSKLNENSGRKSNLSIAKGKSL